MTSADRNAAASSISPSLQNVGIIIPTYNAERFWPELSASLEFQQIAPDQVLIVDSSSTDCTRTLAEQCGYRVICIPHSEFGHGATRQMACEYFAEAELLVFMTQDAVLGTPDAVENLCRSLNDPEVGAAYGRQAPRADAGPIERHARLFNYPERSHVKGFESRDTLGIKAAFCSNSFAVYRRTALLAIGGFPKDVILAEDSVVAARLLMAGWKVAYCADAVVIHSHPIRLRQEFTRYFDTGAHHSREAWLQKTFGGAHAEGKLFLQSEIRYLRAHAPHLIPLALFRTLNKLAAYRLGKFERYLPLFCSRWLSGSPGFWNNRPALGTVRVQPAACNSGAQPFPSRGLALLEQQDVSEGSTYPLASK